MNNEQHERINQVIHGLLPGTHLANQFGRPATLAERMAFHQTPGVSVAVVDNYEIEWARGFGVREAGGREAVTTDTLFQAGSISKPIFALGVMRLVEQGLLALDEDINHYLKRWQLPPNGEWQPRITLRHLLSHMAGLTVHGFPGYGQGQALPTLPQILDGTMPANTDPVRVNLLPGMQFRYSGGGTTVAQLSVEDVVGRPLPEIMRELVLEPAGAYNSTYQQPLPAEWAKKAATAHPWASKPLPGKHHLYPEMAAAGLWSTPSDLARLGIEVMRAWRGDEDALIKPATAQEMLRPVTPGRVDNIGVGFMLMEKEEGSRFGHGGWDEGFVAESIFFKQGGRGAVVMLNSNQGHPLLGELMRSISTAYQWPGFLPEPRKRVELAPEQMATLAGSYQTEAGLPFKVEAAEGGILLHPPGQPPLIFFSESETLFFTRDLNAEIRVKTDTEDGKPSLTFHQEGEQYPLQRVDG
jgi:CubicO group peptidase (beta-lactamase class C family)